MVFCEVAYCLQFLLGHKDVHMRNEMLIEPTGNSEKIRAPDGCIRLDHGGSWVRIPSGTRIFSEFPVGSINISFLMCIYHSHIRSHKDVAREIENNAYAILFFLGGGGGGRGKRGVLRDLCK